MLTICISLSCYVMQNLFKMSSKITRANSCWKIFYETQTKRYTVFRSMKTNNIMIFDFQWWDIFQSNYFTTVPQSFVEIPSNECWKKENNTSGVWYAIARPWCRFRQVSLVHMRGHYVIPSVHKWNFQQAFHFSKKSFNNSYTCLSAISKLNFGLIWKF